MTKPEGEMRDEEKRKYLKSKGWKRRDRTSQGTHVELWRPPWDPLRGFEPLAISLESAYKKQRKQENGC